MSNDGWIVSTPVHTFTTPQPSIYVYVDQPTQITATTAFISGRIDPKFYNWSSDSQMKQPVFIYYSTDINNLDKLKDGGCVGADVVNYGFGTTITRLKPATTYYYKVGAYWFIDQDTESMYFTNPESFTTSAE